MVSARSITTGTYLLVAISLVAAACSSSGETDENGSTTSIETSQDTEIDQGADASTSTTKPNATTIEQDTQDMCRTLDLLSFAGVTAGPASQSLTRTDLAGLSAAATAQYGNLLVSAPREACQEHIPFADEIAYWLGF